MFATVSLFSYCGLSGSFEPVCTLQVSHSISVLIWYVCCADMLSHIKSLSHISHISFITDDDYTGLHEIRFAGPLESTAPWSSASSSIHSPPHICPLSHWLLPGQIWSCYGVCEMLSVTLWRAIRAFTSPEECWWATACASIAQLSSACLGDTADREDGARPGVAARLHHGAKWRNQPFSLSA